MMQSMTASCCGFCKLQRLVPCQRHGMLIVCAVRQQGHMLQGAELCSVGGHSTDGKSTGN
jgi:hypothetical protein